MPKFFDNPVLLLGIVLLISNFCFVEASLRNVRLVIEPAAVQRYHHATIRCLYDSDIPLYSVKFYRGLREFYRYSPSEIPKNKIFPFPGINVDLGQSNSSQVVIRNVGFGLSGNFSCEVTADAPLFSTKTAYNQMQVVELPDRKPQLYTEHERYEHGDILQANCTSSPSKPQTELMLTLNNQVLQDTEQFYVPTTDGLIQTKITLRMQLQFRNSANLAPNSIQTALLLRCTAMMGSFYSDYTEMEIGTIHKDPVPARVTLNTSSIQRTHNIWFCMMSLYVLLFLDSLLR